MTDFRILELTEGLGIKECPKCQSKEFIVHKDYSYRVNVETEKIEEISACQGSDYEISRVRCAKCGTLVSPEQDLVIFKTSIKEILKQHFEREPTEQEFLDFWHYLDVDIGQWLVDNVKCFVRDKQN